ncbi:MAG TPA: ATP-binding protein [Streptosporangiaceae bacterium]|nr:ATP-binding protein [Streptosporangiaceae bacterium]
MRSRVIRLAAVARPSGVRRWWLDRSVRVKGMIAVSAPLIALAAVTVASLLLQAAERQERDAEQVESNLTSAASQVLVDMVNAETGVRGYAATANPLFLAPYSQSQAQLGTALASFRAAAITEGSAREERAIAATAARETSELTQLRASVASGVSGRALEPRMAAGKATMDLLRRQEAALTDKPAAVLVMRRAEIMRLESEIGTLTTAGLALGLLAGLIGIALFTSGIASRVAAAAANADRLGKGHDLEPTPEANDEIGRLTGSLESAQELLLSRSAELTAARDQALTASQAKNAFLSSTSHELRTPLNAVLGFAQLLQMSDLAEEDKDSVERILAAGRHLLALINELIDIARIESGEFSLSVEPVLLPPVVEEICRLMTPLAADRSITISQHCTHPGLAVRADSQRLRQVLVNLISNGIKYNSHGGSLSVACRPDGPDLGCLVVTDTGPGILDADLDRIFAPFERLGAERTAIEGTGIGLPLARAFAEAMNGQLTASSVVGEGSAFTLTLPRAADIVHVPAQKGGDASAQAALGKPVDATTRILYIEDNPANVEVVARFLRPRSNLLLLSATSGRSGLDLAIREVPDLILLDLHLPDLTGEEVLDELKAMPATAGIPVAVVSAEAAPTMIRGMRAKGVIAYLTKPLDLGELATVIDSFPAGREHEAEASPGATP